VKYPTQSDANLPDYSFGHLFLSHSVALANKTEERKLSGSILLLRGKQ
jgi:hypothetical protein